MNNILRRFTACTLTALLALSLSVLPAQAADDTATESTTPNTGPVIDEDSTEDQSPETVDVTLVTDHVRYLGGYPDGTVQPNKAVTRAEAAAILYRLLDDPESGTGSCSYTDVTDGQWYAGNVRALCRLGLFDDGETFRPNDAITRAELVDLLVRLAPDVRATASFSDVPANYWAADAIAKATSLGWIAGYEDGTFRPDNSLTRAEACAFINRVTEREGPRQKSSSVSVFSATSTPATGPLPPSPKQPSPTPQPAMARMRPGTTWTSPASPSTLVCMRSTAPSTASTATANWR